MLGAQFVITGQEVSGSNLLNVLLLDEDRLVRESARDAVQILGFHTLMALAPAYHMARELPNDRQALPVLKVLYRNTNRIGEVGGRAHEVLHRVEPDCCLPDDRSAAARPERIVGVVPELQVVRRKARVDEAVLFAL